MAKEKNFNFVPVEVRSHLSKLCDTIGQSQGYGDSADMPMVGTSWKELTRRSMTRVRTSLSQVLLKRLALDEYSLEDLPLS